MWLQLVDADPAAANDLKFAEDVRNAAIGKEANDAAFSLLETSMGPLGYDILYDIAYGSAELRRLTAAAATFRQTMGSAYQHGVCPPA